jgi:hypothetical protein
VTLATAVMQATAVTVAKSKRKDAANTVGTPAKTHQNGEKFLKKGKTCPFLAEMISVSQVAFARSAV